VIARGRYSYGRPRELSLLGYYSWLGYGVGLGLGSGLGSVFIARRYA